MTPLPVTHVLVPLPEINYSPEYLLMARPGALNHLLLHPYAAARLRRARAGIRRRSTNGQDYDLHVWDGYRPYDVQEDIFDEYVKQLCATGMPLAEAEAAAVTFVRHPASVYPHGTGGTIDLTLTINGALANLGTTFDDFTPKAHRHWYHTHPPTTPHDNQARHLRYILDHEMTHVGFVGIDDEWWHYEFGTHHWATVNNTNPILTTTISRRTQQIPAAS